MQLSRFLIFGVCAFSVIAMAGEEGRLSGPVSGFVFDRRSHSVRPMLGVPGASYLGSSLASGVDTAAIAPNGTIALAAQGRQLSLVRGLDAAAPELAAIEGALATTDRIVWGRTSSSAAIYSSASRQLQILRGLTQTATAGEAVDLSSLTGSVSALAVDDSGTHALVGVQGEEGGGVYLVQSARAPRLLGRFLRPIAILLNNQGRDLLIADRDTSEIWEIRDYQESATLLLITGALSEPAGMQLARDGRALYVASAGSKTLDVVDLTARTATARIPLDFTPSAVDCLGRNPVWLLNTASEDSEPFFVLDASDNPAVYFVPAATREQ